MTSVLFIGQEPDTVDFSDSALPPGLDAAKIQAGIAAIRRQRRVEFGPHHHP